MQFPILEYKQNSHSFFSVILPFTVVDEFSHILIYGKNDGGYQREPDSIHYNKIKKYILSNNEFLFPTSIILGIDEETVPHLLLNNGNERVLDLGNVNSKELFRIIDGQHRIIAIREASSEKQELKNLCLNVTVLITPKNKRSLEMEIFNTINSKAKRIRVDLIQLARYDYRILEGDVEYSDLNEHIAIQVAYLLNEDSKSVWHNAIKFGIHDEQKIGIVGVSAFIESLKPVITKYLKINNSYANLKKNQLIEFSKTAALEVKNFVKTLWDEIIFKKWPLCFSDNQDIETDLEIKKFKYNSLYYLQKTLGTKAINYYLLGSILNANHFENPLSQQVINEFENKITNSILTIKDWEVGKLFTGYSSESAFSKVGKMITGSLEIPKS